jgi:hypothetical protein
MKAVAKPPNLKKGTVFKMTIFILNIFPSFLQQIGLFNAKFV